MRKKRGRSTSGAGADSPSQATRKTARVRRNADVNDQKQHAEGHQTRHKPKDSEEVNSSIESIY